MNFSVTRLSPTVMLLLSLLSLGGCSTAALIEMAHPDRVKFQATDEDGTVYHYLCSPKDSDAETTQQFESAHAYLIKESQRISEATVGKMMSDVFERDEKPSFLAFIGSYMGASVKMMRQAKQLGPQIDAQFGCLVTEVDDSNLTSETDTEPDTESD